MNATINPQPLLSASLRVAAIAAALAIIGATVAVAGRASEQAVRTAHAAMDSPVGYVVVHPLEITAQRAADPLAAACANVRNTSI